MTDIVNYSFLLPPDAPTFVVEKPVGTRPFTKKDGGTRFRYKGTTTCPRVEISPWGPKPSVQTGVRLVKGEIYLHRVRFRIPSDTPILKAKFVIFQWHQKNGRNPPLSLELVGSELRLIRLHGDATYGNPNREVLWRRTIARNVTYTVNAAIRFSSGATGQILWSFHGDLERVFDGPNCYTDLNGLNPKLGIYYPNAREGATDVILVDFFEWVIL